MKNGNFFRCACILPALLAFSIVVCNLLFYSDVPESEECLLDEASAAGGHGHHKGRDTKSRVNGHQSRPKGCGSGLTTQQKQKAEETDDELQEEQYKV